MEPNGANRRIEIWSAISRRLATPRRVVIADWPEFAMPHDAPDDPEWPAPVGWGPVRSLIDLQWPKRQRVTAAWVAARMAVPVLHVIAPHLPKTAVDAIDSAIVALDAAKDGEIVFGDSLFSARLYLETKDGWTVRSRVPISIASFHPYAVAAYRALFIALTVANRAWPGRDDFDLDFNIAGELVADAVDAAAHAVGGARPAFYAAWWRRVRARLAFADAPTATLE